jgi:hypothetical protein
MVCEWRLGKMRICNTQSTIDGIHICMLQCNAMDSRNIYRIYTFWARWMLRVGDREMGWFLLSLGEPHSKRCGLSLCSSFWVNYNISLTWIKAIRGWFPLWTIWGRYNLPRSLKRCWVEVHDPPMFHGTTPQISSGSRSLTKSVLF